MRALTLLIAAFAALSFSVAIRSCVCDRYASPPEAYSAASSIYSGVVTRVEEQGKDSLANPNGQVSVITVTTTFKGKALKEVRFREEYSDCSPHLKVGYGVLIYGDYDASSGDWSFGYCNLIVLLDHPDAIDHLEYLCNPNRINIKSRIAGVLSHVERDSRNWGNEFVKYLSNIPITLTGGKKEYDTRTSAKGFFSFGNVPPGKYHIEVHLPPNMMLSGGYSSGVLPMDVTKSPLSINLPADGCYSVYITASLRRGIVEGRVVDNAGKGLPHVLIEALASTATNEPSAPTTLSDSNGKYRIVGLLAGSYILKATSAFADSPSRMHCMAYYPGDPNLRDAKSVSIIENAVVKGCDIILDCPKH